jgi:SAM-dependent methyltransferase/uncharacterized protein YbaR (Trm112 family)
MPNMRSNVLADKFLADDAERQQPIALDERPFVVCDALYLPFKDRSVDYVICSHLAEHVEEPEALFAELSRVAAAGYVECPGRVREMLHGWEFHRWYVEVRGDELVFEEKPRKLHDKELHEWFARRFESDREFESFFVDNMERLNLVAAYDWVGRIKYTVRRLPHSAWQRTAAELGTHGPVARGELSALLERLPVRHLTRNERIKQRLARLARRRSDTTAAARLRSMLCCPKCKGELEGGGRDELTCAPCGATFPVVGNVYYLVPEQVPGWRPRLLTESVAAH